jgi:hypothetical protein
MESTTRIFVGYWKRFVNNSLQVSVYSVLFGNHPVAAVAAAIGRFLRKSGLVHALIPIASSGSGWVVCKKEKLRGDLREALKITVAKSEPGLVDHLCAACGIPPSFAASLPPACGAPLQSADQLAAQPANGTAGILPVRGV